MFGAQIGWVGYGDENCTIDYINKWLNKVYVHGANIEYIRHGLDALI